MLGCSQITRPRTSVAVSAPGDGDADGYDRPVAGLRQALLIPADPGTSRRARRSGERVTAAYSPSVIRGSLMTVHIRSERVSRWVRTPARLPDHEGSSCLTWI
jgi:hypothetical protein